jgi:flagellin
LSQGVRADQIGQIATATGSAVDGNAIAGGGDVTIKVGEGTATSIVSSGSYASSTPTDGRSASSAYAKAAAINASGVAGLSATAASSTTVAWADVTATVAASADATFSLSVNGEAVFTNHALSAAALTGADVAEQINLYSGDTGVTASFAGGNLTLTSIDGRDIITDQTLTAGTETITGAGLASEGTVKGTLTLSASENIQIGGSGGQLAQLGFGSANIAKDTNTISNVNVLTVDASNDAMKRIDAALTAVSDVRSSLGAIQNRFESTINNLQTVSENLSASRSRILDADFAAETANLTRAQILQQAGTAILAQANSVPQNVLSLLR